MNIHIPYKNTLIIGLGVSGRSAARFLLNRQLKVSAVDKNIDLIKDTSEISELIHLGLEIFSETDPPNIHLYDLIIVSPGIPTTHSIYQACLKAKKEIIGEIEFACRFINKICLGITGTNGKTTTTLLVEHILNYSGIKAIAAGNVGKPLTQVLQNSTHAFNEVVVIELSSWQLETMQSQILDGAVILNITPNHLDRHKTMDAYASAKFQIGRCLKPQKKLYISHETFQKFSAFLPTQNPTLTFGYQPQNDIYCDKEKIFLLQKYQFFLPENLQHKVFHEVENLMAAYALCHDVGVSSENFLAALSSFKKPLHRLEFVRKFKGVSYYDDSKATSIDAVVKGVNSLPGKVILIAGGVHKGFSYIPWIEGFREKVSYLYAIGEASEQMKRELSQNMSVNVCLNLEEAVFQATKQANEGENVLLSPGCASYDMFKNYEQRGDMFKQLVNSLQ